MDHRLRRRHGPRWKRVIVAREDEAGTHRANLAGGTLTRHFDYILVSLDLVDVVSRPTSADEFPSALHKPVESVLGAEKKEINMLMQHMPNKLSGYSCGEGRVKWTSAKKEEGRGGHSKGRDPRTQQKHKERSRKNWDWETRTPRRKKDWDLRTQNSPAKNSPQEQESRPASSKPLALESERRMKGSKPECSKLQKQKEALRSSSKRGLVG